MAGVPRQSHYSAGPERRSKPPRFPDHVSNEAVTVMIRGQLCREQIHSADDYGESRGGDGETVIARKKPALVAASFSFIQRHRWADLGLPGRERSRAAPPFEGRTPRPNLNAASSRVDRRGSDDLNHLAVRSR
jgi:hypothetical protein